MNAASAPGIGKRLQSPLLRRTALPRRPAFVPAGPKHSEDQLDCCARGARLVCWQTSGCVHQGLLPHMSQVASTRPAASLCMPLAPDNGLTRCNTSTCAGGAGPSSHRTGASKRGEVLIIAGGVRDRWADGRGDGILPSSRGTCCSPAGAVSLCTGKGACLQGACSGWHSRWGHDNLQGTLTPMRSCVLHLLCR